MQTGQHSSHGSDDELKERVRELESQLVRYSRRIRQIRASLADRDRQINQIADQFKALVDSIKELHAGMRGKDGIEAVLLGLKKDFENHTMHCRDHNGSTASWSIAIASAIVSGIISWMVAFTTGHSNH